jgi:hypothetical protein
LGGWRGRSGAQRPGADRQAPVPRAWRAAPPHGRRLPVAAFALHRRCACDIPPARGLDPRWVFGWRGRSGAQKPGADRQAPSRVRGARPHPTGGASMPPRSRSTAAVHATSRPIPQATHHRTTHVRACLRTCVRRCAARSSRRRPASSDRGRLRRAGPPRPIRPIARAPWDRTWRDGGRGVFRLITCNRKALSKLRKESRPCSARGRCNTRARRRDETSISTSVSPQPAVIQ